MLCQLRTSLVRYLLKTKTPPPNETTGSQLGQLFQDISDQVSSISNTSDRFTSRPF
jgi:hypothetical protein